MNLKKMKSLALLVSSLLISTGLQVSGGNPPPDPSLCGQYPTNYKEIVMKWLQTQLIDASSARIEWEGEPTPADLGSNNQHLYGYLVNFKVNARNRFGAYTGKQEHGALIRNGEVVKGLGFAYQ
jgi:hypothetical protein